MTVLKAITKEGYLHTLSEAQVQRIPLFKDMECICSQATQGDIDDEKNIITLENIDKTTLEDVLNTLNSANPNEAIQLLAEKDIERVASVANAANFLQLDDLVDAFCYYVINVFDQMPPLKDNILTDDITT